MIWINAEKVFDKIQYPFFIKTLNKVGTEETCIHIIRAVYDRPVAQKILNNEKPNAFPLRSGRRKSVHYWHFYSK